MIMYQLGSLAAHRHRLDTTAWDRAGAAAALAGAASVAPALPAHNRAPPHQFDAAMCKRSAGAAWVRRGCGVDAALDGDA